MVAIVCDGYGYGIDGGAWGGETLHCNLESTEFVRLGHLEAQPLLGGDLASHYPLRLAAGTLQKAGVNVKDWLMQNSKHLPHGEIEAKLILQQLKVQKGSIETTSCGRVLDAVAAVLGICFERSYEGEPAMKLESIALASKNMLQIQPQMKGDVLDTTCMMRTVFDSLGRVSAADLAYSAHAYLARGLAELAIQGANTKSVKNIGFSGGAACNQILTQLIRESIESAGLRFFVHETVPAGDGGISFGQAVVAGFSKL
jgi:hydrogenase maturation protein HypF